MTTDRELMQMALDALEKHILEYETVEALRARLAQPEPEPVAWMEVVKRIDPNSREISEQTILRNYDTGHGEPLYTAPPQREWQGLTDEEIENCFEMSMFGTCRAIEAKLKAKNA